MVRAEDDGPNIGFAILIVELGRHDVAPASASIAMIWIVLSVPGA
jgi:hypothetical protein